MYILYITFLKINKFSDLNCTVMAHRKMIPFQAISQEGHFARCIRSISIKKKLNIFSTCETVIQ